LLAVLREQRLDISAHLAVALAEPGRSSWQAQVNLRCCITVETRLSASLCPAPAALCPGEHQRCPSQACFLTASDVTRETTLTHRSASSLAAHSQLSIVPLIPHLISASTQREGVRRQFKLNGA